MKYSIQAYGVYELTKDGHLRRIHYRHIGITSLSTPFTSTDSGVNPPTLNQVGFNVYS